MGKKILLADDSITIQKVIELTFSDEDFEVVTVGNGRLAVERFDEVRPDIVLCDIIMPEKDGYEVCDFIKKHASFGHVPVLLLTGAFEPFDQERAARVGCDGFLAKPFEPQSLISKVKDLLSQAAARPRPVPAPAPAAPAPPSIAPPAASAPPVDPLAVTMPAAPAPSVPPPAFVAPEPEPEPEIEAETFAPADQPEAAPFEEPPPASLPGTFSQPMELTQEPGTPPPPYVAPALVEDFGGEEPVVASTDELMPLMAEEAASLEQPAPAPTVEDAEATARTVMFKASEAPPWSQPTVEVPLETRAQATIAAAVEAARPVFEPPPPAEAPLPEEVGFEAPDFGEPAAPPPAEAPPAPAPEPTPPPAPPPPLAFVAPAAPVVPPPAPPAPEPEEVSFADIRPPEPEAPAPPAPSHAAEVSVPMEQVAQIAQRVVAQISERVVREVAWEVIPDLAETLIRKEIERLRAELEKA
ncbi:MAG TPA: response regulator [Vicinamibacteria bacterium]|nr:response regulator [Vicinamibacteria bacterium]